MGSVLVTTKINMFYRL